jgi:uncharacterized protein (DUF4415 family)
MPKKSEKSKPGTASKPGRGVWHDPDDVPEITDAMLDRAEVVKDGKVIRRGRPSLGGAAKVPVTLRLDPDVLKTFRDTGEGWQSRMNDVLKKSAERMKKRA